VKHTHTAAAHVAIGILLAISCDRIIWRARDYQKNFHSFMLLSLFNSFVKTVASVIKLGKVAKWSWQANSKLVRKLV
jgi:hypothetical protein